MRLFAITADGVREQGKDSYPGAASSGVTRQGIRSCYFHEPLLQRGTGRGHSRPERVSVRAEQGLAADGLQRPLRSRFRQQLKPSVRRHQSDDDPGTTVRMRTDNPALTVPSVRADVLLALL
jgi:hypothetical protein